MWNDRYAQPGFHFGTDPAAFLTAQAHHLTPGSTVLAVADGEGRNSVYLAGLGHRVTAMDASPVGLEKARGLAAKAGVTVDYHLSDIEAWDWRAEAFDAVAAIFIQFSPPEMRAQVFAGIDRTLKPGGLLLLHGYAPRQVGYGTGGPPWVEHMYTLEMLREAFAGYEVVVARDYDADIQEGRGHSGVSGLVDFVARKGVGTAG
ncbi:MAG: class I SAM-dependent methyltransferase [Pseudomonadota bacterium]